MPDPGPIPQEEVLQAAEFRRLLRRFLAHGDAGVRRAGLTPQRYLLLLAVKGAPDRTETRSIGQLSDDLQLAQSSVTELVDRAEAAGLVARATGNRTPARCSSGCSPRARSGSWPRSQPSGPSASSCSSISTAPATTSRPAPGPVLAGHRRRQ